MTSNNLGSIGYDPASRITNAYGKTYSYDSIDRLKTYNDGASLHTYNWDATGNRTSQSIGSTSNTYAIDANSNKIKSISAGTTTKTYIHDNNGNVTGDGTYTFSFDSINRLTQANLGTTIKGSYTYNGLGQRAKKVAASTVLFFYDEAGKLLGEFSPVGVIQETIYLGDIPVITISNGAIYYIHTDHLNTPRKITDASKNVRWMWDTATFGATTPNEKPNTSLAALNYNYRFPGQYSDSETGLYYNYFRDYDPKTGRYLQSDPIGLAGGINTYAYVNGNPLSFSDPLGLTPKQSEGNEKISSRSCNAAERQECKAICGNRGVDVCFVERYKKIKGVNEKGKKRFGFDERMTCSCNDEDSNCSTNEQSLFEKFLRKLTTPQARDSGETGNPDIDNALRGTNSKRSIGGSSGGGILPTPVLVIP